MTEKQQQGYPYHPDPGQPQVVYIQTQAADDRYQSFNGKLAVIFGILIIILTTVLILLNGLAFHFQIDREYDWIGNIIIIMFPTGWSLIFTYLSGAFAIAAGKRKSSCLIKANLVLAIIASVTVGAVAGVLGGAVAYDVGDLDRTNINQTAVKNSLAVAVVLVILAVVEFVFAVWCAVLSCRVICCPKRMISNQPGQPMQPVY